MKNVTNKVVVPLAGRRLVFGTARRKPNKPGSRGENGETFNPRILSQPGSLLVKRGRPAEFEVDPALRRIRDATFQWFLNGNEIDQVAAKRLGIRGSTKPKLTVPSTKERHVGFYQCSVLVPDTEEYELALLTEPAELMMFSNSVLTVYGTPIGGAGGGGGNCPPQYVGYVNFRKPAAPYGWTLSNPAAGGTATDPQNANTVVRYFGSTLAKNGCGTGSVAVPPGNDAYRFTIYFTSGSVPSGPYSIQLNGFNNGPTT